MSLNIPFVILMVWTFVIWVWLYFRRLRWMAKAQIRPQTLATRRDIASIPPSVQKVADNFQNLLELPILFYLLCFYLAWGNEVGVWDVVLAYGFVALRVAHSLIHCTYNRVTHRFVVYVLGAICLWLMLARVVWGMLV